MSTVNTQVLDSVTDTVTTVIGNAPAEGFALLDTVMAETVGMLMHNAVNTQTNSQMIGNAAVTATCAKMLSVPPPSASSSNKPIIPPFFPVVSPSGGSPSGSPSGGSPHGSPPLVPSGSMLAAQNTINQMASDAAAASSDEASAQKNLQALAEAARKANTTH